MDVNEIKWTQSEIQNGLAGLYQLVIINFIIND